MERLTMTSNKGGVAFTFDLDITCKPSEVQKILRLAEKLKQYEDAEEQGLLVRLPCKVGDSIWVNGILGCGEAEEYKVIRVDYHSYHSTLGTKRNEFYIEGLLASNPTGGSIGFYDKEFGKTVFLTKAEAQQALEKMDEAAGSV